MLVGMGYLDGEGEFVVVWLFKKCSLFSFGWRFMQCVYICKSDLSQQKL